MLRDSLDHSSARPALADTLQPTESYGSGITRVSKGVKEIGLDSMLVVGYDKAGEASSLRATLFTGPTFRYFLRDNLSLALNASFLYKTASAGDLGGQTHLGGLATVAVGYYASLGRGFSSSRRSARAASSASARSVRSRMSSAPTSSAAPAAPGSGSSSTRARGSTSTRARRRWCRSARATPLRTEDS